MGRKKIPGLVKRGETWHIDKVIGGKRVCQSTGTDDLEEAERFLALIIENVRQEQIYGLRTKGTFRMAVTKYLDETVKRSLARDATCLANLDPFIGDMGIDEIHMGTLQHYVNARRKEGIKSGTVRRELAVVRPD